MKYQSQLQAVLAIALCTLSAEAFAQGVAGGPFSNHTVQWGPSFPSIFVGSPANPVPIDLDPSGGPWTKSVSDPLQIAVGPQLIEMFETIINVGTEPWDDWHEHILPPNTGMPPSTWAGGSVSLTVNGNPISFTANGFGTQILDLYGFSQPVLPGDVFGIRKQIDTSGSLNANGAFLTIQQYPTSNTVPEPVSFALVAIGVSGLACMRRRLK